MNSSDPLANLRDIHLPGDVSWWPLAPGWWVLIILLSVLAIWSLIQWRKRQKHRQLIVELRQELAQINQQYSEHQSEQALVVDYSELLKRLLMLHRGRAESANISREQWLEVINQYMPDQPLSDDFVTLLTEGKYQRQVSIADTQPLSNWVEACALAIGQQIVKERMNA